MKIKSQGLQVSNCCKAEMEVLTGNEGTSCWVCKGCNHACDSYVEPEPKEGILIEQIIERHFSLDGDMHSLNPQDRKKLIRELKQFIADLVLFTPTKEREGKI